MLLSRTIRVIKPLAYFSSIPDNILAVELLLLVTFKSISHFCELLQFNEPITFFCGYTGTSIIIIYLSKYFNT